MINKLYNQTDPESIEQFGKRLVGYDLNKVQGVLEIPAELKDVNISGNTRGSLGTLVERYYYGITPANDGSPDFPEAEVELKTTPVKKRADGSYVAKERLVLGMIDYVEEKEHEFNTSSFYKKNKDLMLLSYLHEDGKRIGDLRFLSAKRFEYNKLPKEDQKIIREDWEKINAKIKANLAHELSEGDTLYLAACTKSASSKNRRVQADGTLAKPRAYSYKSSYMTLLLNRELGTRENIEKILTVEDLATNLTFEEQVLERFKPFIGKTTAMISKTLGVELSQKHKDRYAVLARAMMGIRGRRIEEFEAAGVLLKTIQTRKDGVPKESMSFPTFKYTELLNERWDADEEEGQIRSAFQKQLESRFLFVVYRSQNNLDTDEDKILEKVFFWTMPAEDLAEAKNVWEETVKRIREERYDNMPSMSESPVAHVRPHGRNAADVYPTPNGGSSTKKCFWLNAPYLYKIINKYEIQRIDNREFI